jgi:hypothetical protein
VPQETVASMRIQHLHSAAQSRMRKQLRMSSFHPRQAGSMCTFYRKCTENSPACQMGQKNNCSDTRSPQTLLVSLAALSLSKGRTSSPPPSQGQGAPESEPQSVRSATRTRALQCHCRRTTSFDIGYRPLRMGPARCSGCVQQGKEKSPTTPSCSWRPVASAVPPDHPRPSGSRR